MPRKSRWQIETEADPNVIVHHGATVSQIAHMFGMHKETVKGKLSAVQPRDVSGVARYPLKEAAPYLVKPLGSIEDAMRTMNADALPANLRKEYWSAKRQEQAYRKEEGELWETNDVLAAFAEVFKDIRTKLLLLGEAVEREMELPDRAREIIRGNTDAIMMDIRESLIERWGSPDPDAPPAEETDPDLEGLEDDDGFAGL